MKTKDETAIDLASMHYRIEPGMDRIFRIVGPDDNESDPKEPIKVLEVNSCTVACGIMPIYFGPSRTSGTTYPIVIVEVTPEEFERLLEGQARIASRLGNRRSDPPSFASRP